MISSCLYLSCQAVFINWILFYIVDGRKSSPVNHGPSTPATFLEDAARVCQEYMKRDPDEVRFTVVALTPVE